MNKHEIMTHADTYCIHLIYVEEDPDKLSETTLHFIGSIDDFFESSIALDIHAVFVNTCILDERDFLCDIDDIIVDDDKWEHRRYHYVERSHKDSNGIIDLSIVNPAIAQYKSYINSDCLHKLFISLPHKTLTMLVGEDWWDGFIQCKLTGIEEAMKLREGNLLARYEEIDKQNDEIKSQLQLLLDDYNFTRLNTQSAMHIYIIEKYPELKDNEHFDLHNEISTLYSIIRARGLNRKQKHEDKR